MDLAYLHLRIRRDGFFLLAKKAIKLVVRTLFLFTRTWLMNGGDTLFPGQARARKAETKTRLIKVYQEANEVLKQLGVSYWLDGGACLGAIREKDFLSHDTDIDFGVWDVENRARVNEALVENGFVFKESFGRIERGYEESFERHGIRVDIFYFYESGDYWWNGAGVGETSIRILPKRLFQHLQEIDFYGKTFVPHPVEDFLTLRYGNWKQRKVHWHWEMSPPCVRPKTVLTPFVSIETLKCAKQLGERLVVVTDDPVFVKSIRWVDEAYLPSEDLLSRINPDVFVGAETTETKRLGIAVISL